MIDKFAKQCYTNEIRQVLILCPAATGQWKRKANFAHLVTFKEGENNTAITKCS